MYSAERAIIMAAGKGSRLNPITRQIPKPLICVNGRKMIDSIIDALHQNGIYEIYIVVGYLKEQFSYLAEKYEDITLIENPYYDSYNNISSLYCARNYIENSIILDGDQLIYNPLVLKPKFERSGYNAVWVEKTNEWLMQVENDVVVECNRNGGINGWQLYSISRWSGEDGARLKKHLEIEFEEKKSYDLYWDDVVMFCYPDEYQLGIYIMEQEDVVEIDNINELIAIDNSYEGYREKDSNEEE